MFEHASLGVICRDYMVTVPHPLDQAVNWRFPVLCSSDGSMKIHLFSHISSARADSKIFRLIEL